MNKTIGGKQCTICCHVEYLNILHASPKIVDKVLSLSTTKYVKVSPLTVIQGCMHNYLVVQLDCGTKGKV